MTRGGTVLMSGMFDMNNYGDLLFPLVAQDRLASAGYSLIPVAPTGGQADFPDALPTIDIAAMMSGDVAAAGVLIGGGYMVHANSLGFLDHYGDPGLGNWAGVGLWLGATLAGALRDIPIAWNAPGVPHPFSSRQQKLVGAALRAASYVSVRDEGSRRLLGTDAADADILLVPDPIADLPRLWSKADLAADYRALLARKGIAPDARLLAIHIRNRSVAGVDPARWSAALRDFADAQGLVPMLVAVGESHDDPAVARRFAQTIGAPCLMLDDPLSLREITAALAHSALYVGASLHGYIAASTYGVPGVLIGRPNYHKFSGFLSHNGRPKDLATDWEDALRIAATRTPGREETFVPDSVRDALDRHWARIIAALDAPDRQHEERRDFALALMRDAIGGEGPGWAMTPLLNRRMRAQPAMAGGLFDLPPMTKEKP
jgi:hypothetical protein